MAKKREKKTTTQAKSSGSPDSPAPTMRKLRDAFVAGVHAVGQGKVQSQVEINGHNFKGHVALELPGILASRSELENFVCATFQTSVDPSGFMYVRSQEYPHPLALRVIPDGETFSLLIESGQLYRFKPDAVIDDEILEAFSHEGAVVAQAVLLVTKVIGEILLGMEDVSPRKAG